MKVTNRSYPFPVLRDQSDDYYSTHFIASVTNMSEDENFIYINFDFSLNNNELKELIHEKKCFYGIHLECPKTHFRKVFKTYSEKYEIKISKELLRLNVEINTFIIAAETIKDYYSDFFNFDYEGSAFDIDKGSRLAVGNLINIDIEENDEHQDASPIFIYRKSAKLNPDPIEIITNAETVIIELSPQNFKLLNNIKNNQSSFIECSIGLPIIVQLLEKFKNDSITDQNSRWTKAISAKLASLNITFEDDEPDLVNIANKIMGDALSRGLLSMKEVIFSVDNEDEGVV
ncbi:hypothetical protein [Guptibacillus hwajinpoensis]|uniref:hypothetical protein n=1 Tax=Guptibacillus hwajinpoensis TaxID=208199 RepID=UPI0024B3B9B0|nr:hypothetical protein [Pseudalkalibacillus hwajinpoensis]